MTDRPSFRRAAIALTTAALVASGLAGCSRPNQEAASASPSLVTLSPAQRQRIRLLTVEPTGFRNTIGANGVVDFDNDQATSVIAPFSGPVVRLLVSVGDRVAKGQPLALVDSIDFGAAAGAYR